MVARQIQIRKRSVKITARRAQFLIVSKEVLGKETATICLKMGAKRNHSKTNGMDSMLKRYIRVLGVNPDPVEKYWLEEKISRRSAQNH